jgi:prephenate dehydrogenase
MKLKKVVIIGLGLIGGSIAKALKKNGLADEIVGVCRRQSSLDRAIKEKALTTGYVNNYDEAVAGADMVFIATPVHIEKEMLEALSAASKSGRLLVTDVGSTKKEIVDYASRFKDKISFIGGHPLAGSEKSGVEYSSADLFQGSLCVLTKDESTSEADLEKIRRVWEAMGAVVDITTPGKHDEILSFTSHLAHIVAYALTGVQKSEYGKYMSTGFRDTTRIASSDPVLWSDIFVSNRDNILKTLERFKELLSGIEKDIQDSRRESLKDKLEVYKKIRDEIL